MNHHNEILKDVVWAFNTENINSVEDMLESMETFHNELNLDSPRPYSDFKDDDINKTSTLKVISIEYEIISDVASEKRTIIIDGGDSLITNAEIVYALHEDVQLMINGQILDPIFLNGMKLLPNPVTDTSAHYIAYLGS